ncbi:MAG TPA: hypothetical protein ENJ01_06540 [Gammaproteobacteria bacterium]|nr:hypothetical protein [Gammaproteobacteria bacterium]
MAIEKVEKTDLGHYFDNLSRVLPTESVDIEVVGRDVGDQPAAQGARLEGISYDAANDTIVLYLGNSGEHNIAGPTEVYVDQDDDGLKSIEVTCKEGHKHIVKLT